MFTLEEIALAYILGILSNLTVDYYFLKRRRISRLYLYYLERLELPIPFKIDQGQRRAMFWLPTFFTTLVTIALFSLTYTHQQNSYNISTLHHIGSYLPSINIKLGLLSPQLWLLGLILGCGLSYLGHFLSWRIFNIFPERLRSFKLWIPLNMIIAVILLICFGSLLGIFIFGTSFYTNITYGFTIVLIGLLLSYLGDAQNTLQKSNHI
ncbi:MAG: hypothetical protein R8N23_06615 [Reichenbachiella sp.]|uniref:hypothetical protein n=1 Tax=Reichenbachiella sp. TaxID=2184521 RepID=UPI002967170C|nr:hypothetical protein [Reichenbachiella sp.]MDW3209517.1 hypothetical protein [Reichenbachiella sp.]